MHGDTLMAHKCRTEKHLYAKVHLQSPTVLSMVFKCRWLWGVRIWIIPVCFTLTPLLLATLGYFLVIAKLLSQYSPKDSSKPLYNCHVPLKSQRSTGFCLYKGPCITLSKGVQVVRYFVQLHRAKPLPPAFCCACTCGTRVQKATPGKYG